MACVVVAEDNLDHQRVIAEVIRRLGHEVIVTGDGQAALKAIREYRPALVVADVDMPHLDGLQLCVAIRHDPEIAGTPVVLVTAYLLPGDPRLADTGALAVLGKPFGVPELTEALRGYLPSEPPVVAGPPIGTPSPANPAFFDALLDCLDAGVAACDAEGRVVLANRTMREFIGPGIGGVPIADATRKFVLLHPDGTPLRTHELALSRALAGENVEHAELLAHDELNRPRWFAVNARPVRDASGAVTGAVAALHDVTSQHRNRQFQHCENEVLKVIADHPHAADATDRILAAIGSTLSWPYLRLWLVDEVTDLLRPAGVYTAPQERPLPVPVSMARGTGLAGTCWQRADLIWVPDLHAADSLVLPSISAGADFRAAGAVPVRSGERIVGVLTFFSYERQEPDSALGVLLTGLAGLIGAFLEQRRSEVLALHLAAATDEYIALVGHELRTPLTSIGAYVDLIAESPDDLPLGEVRELLDVVQRNNARLRDLVEKLLDLAALESGHAKLTIRPVDLTDVVAAAVDAVAPAAAGRGITVEANLPDELTVPGDAERLRQMTDALIENAVKFSRADSKVTVALTDEVGEVAVLTVADNGTGVAPAEQPRLFRRLYRAGNARHTGIPGTGLGLALCRVVVERHHGSITLASHESTGTTVTVRLPRLEV
ncbi:ATP-binding protein [Paractinoplanes abujensis]|uniref:histidine kinase n=1 Tax=Paractinoplanes abujensis TaxID=882441 RepID=A0A7W7G5G0_9ACTN|nr:ATP-binding protein [Actinoplanes abujensis]MBB4698438.1 PAS domain S-box-containing protein [Actinoplanes abujensis]